MYYLVILSLHVPANDITIPSSAPSTPPPPTSTDPEAGGE